MKIGELLLFPAVREAEEKEINVAPGTSCRHHNKDGTGKIALHPVEVLYEALNNNHTKKIFQFLQLDLNIHIICAHVIRINTIQTKLIINSLE